MKEKAEGEEIQYLKGLIKSILDTLGKIEPKKVKIPSILLTEMVWQNSIAFLKNNIPGPLLQLVDELTQFVSQQSLSKEEIINLTKCIDEINYLSRPYVAFEDLGKPISSITEGAHAGKAKLAGQYQHKILGNLFVKQDDNLNKNIVEWAFYHVTKELLSLVGGQEDFIQRLAPIILVAPSSEKKHSAKDIYVGSVAHNNMDLAWKEVYTLAEPNSEVPKTRPGAFEYKYEPYVKQYVESFEDEGFTMLPVFMLLGHYATHLGNLGITVTEQNKKLLLFFDYGAAAWYDISRREFDVPQIKGTTVDNLISLFGVTKNYATHYKKSTYSKEAGELLQAIYDCFQDKKKWGIFYFKIKEIITKLSLIVDDETLNNFLHYIDPADTAE
ncbi:MAG: hypothetical protein H0U73_04780, partial [Tatlockia sp.]|nr:hypothetical protein [Tatlockia sp.]